MTDRTPSATSAPVRRYTLLARGWSLGVVVAVVIVELLGWFAIGLVVLAAGLLGLAILFDAKRSWWGPEVNAMGRERYRTPRTGRAELGLAALLIGVTLLVVLVLVLAGSR
jgi:hypothetical protein